MNSRKYYWILYFSFFIFIFTLLLNNAIYEFNHYYDNTNGSKISIYFNEYINEVWIDTKAVKQVFGSIPTSYYTMINQEILSSRGSSNVNVYGVGGSFDTFYRFYLEYGGFLREEDLINQEYIVVIDQRTAFQLFNKIDVVGDTLTIFGRQFTVVGVIKEEATLLAETINNDQMAVFIPYTLMEVLYEKPLAIKAIEIFNKDLSVYDVEERLKSVGLGLSGLHIESKKIENYKVLQRNKITLFFMTGITTIYILKFIKHIIKGLINSIKEQLKNNYPLETSKKEIKGIMIGLLKISLLIAMLFFLWNRASFDLYIEPSKIANDPTNFKEAYLIFLEALKARLHPQKNVLLPPISVQNYYRNLSSSSTMFSLISGLVIFNLLIKERFVSLELWLVHFSKITKIIIITSGLTIATLLLIGLPISISISQWLILYCCLVFISIYSLLVHPN